MGIDNCDFPFQRRVSLRKVGEFWRREADDPSSPSRAVARELVDLLDRTPALEAPNLTPAALDEHREDIARLFRSMVAPQNRDEVVFIAMGPWGMMPVFESPASTALGFGDALLQEFCVNVTEDMWELGSAVKSYNMILNQLYGVETNFDYPIVATIKDPQTGLVKHLRLDWDPRFVDIRTVGSAAKLSQTDLDRVIAEPMNLPLWLELLPPEDFEFEGIVILTGVDVTLDHALSLLKNDLLATGSLSSPERLDHLEFRIRTLMGQPDLTLGLMAVERGDDFEKIVGARPLGRSLLMSDGQMPSCEFKKDSYYAMAYESREPVVVHDLDACDHCTGFEQKLKSQGIRNLLLWPLYVDGRFVGMVELGSPNPGAINSFNSLKLAEVQELIATAIQREGREREDRIQAVIKQQYTAIHPSVEWRFREAARSFIEADQAGEMAEAEEIVFPGVYPLYGLSDIRGSSELRNLAIQADLREQLALAEDVLQAAFKISEAPLLDHLNFRVSQHRERIEAGLRSEDENSVLEFLRHEVQALFPELRGVSPEVAEAVRAYESAVDPELGVIYRRRRAYEESVALANQTVVAVLEKEEARAQAMHPHFFEQFKTDGVEHTAYVGAALSEGGEFNPLHLNNLRLWQLMMMAEIEWALREDRDRLPVPIDLTHLVLVQDHPMAIRFRIDEKKFDVDGAYNIRYEIAKKRIDKAVIRGSHERLTQPRTLSVVYSQPREAEEYRKYLAYMSARGYIEGPVEEYELEDMQGIHGLKAFRVTIAERPAGRNAAAPSGSATATDAEESRESVTEESPTS